MKIQSGKMPAAKNTEKAAKETKPEGNGSKSPGKATDSFETASTAKARDVENNSTTMPTATRRASQGTGASLGTSQRSGRGPQTQVRKLVRGLTKDKNFSAADGQKLEQEVRKNGISKREIAQLNKIGSGKAIRKLDVASRERLNKQIASLVVAGEAATEASKDRKELLADIKAGSMWKVGDQFNKLQMVLDSPHPYKLSEPVQDTNRSQDDHWIDPETGKVDWKNFHQDPTHVPEKPALTSTLDIHGRQIKIVEEQPPGKNLPTVDEVAKSLSRIRPELLAHVERVELVNENPSDSYMWVNQHIDPGTIEILPTSHKPTERDRGQSLIHEIGHIASIAAPHESEKLNWDAYKKAIATDKHVPSQYGATNKREDFAEFANLHEIFRGTPEEQAFRTLFANRYAAAGVLLS